MASSVHLSMASCAGEGSPGVPGVAGGEGCSTAGGCANCPYMKMNDLDALLEEEEDGLKKTLVGFYDDKTVRLAHESCAGGFGGYVHCPSLEPSLNPGALYASPALGRTRRVRRHTSALGHARAPAWPGWPAAWLPPARSQTHPRRIGRQAGPSIRRRRCRSPGRAAAPRR